MPIFYLAYTGILRFIKEMPRTAAVFLCLIFAFLLLIPSDTVAQNDTIRKKKDIAEHSIARAAIYSAALPGLGQAYNRKYWKIPIIYAGFGVIGYFVWDNTVNFKIYREAYVYKANNETYPIDNPLVDRYDLTQLEKGMDFYRRNRDLSYIVGALWYVVNILEAYVDAHFFDYDISEDLTLRVGPSAVAIPEYMPQPAPGLKIALKF